MEQTFKPKILQFLMQLAIVLFIAITIPITAHAGGVPDPNYSEGTGSSGGGYLENGINTTQQGIVIYVADQGGQMITGLTAVSQLDRPAIFGNNLKNMPMHVKLYDRYPDKNSTSNEKNFDFGAIGLWEQRGGIPLAVPWDPTVNNGNGGWVPQGKDVMDWLLRKDGTYTYDDGETREVKIYEAILQDYMDDAGYGIPQKYEPIWDQLENADGDWVVCVEFLHWNKIWSDSAYIGQIGLGTINAWADINKNIGHTEPKGSSWIRSFTNTAAPFGMMLQKDKTFWEFTPHGGDPMRELENDYMANNDYGLQVITYGAGSSSQTTCDEPKRPDPHEPPQKESKNKPYKIVKCYREKGDNGKYKDMGTPAQFIKTDSSPRIKIEDEYTVPGSYRLIEWRTSETYNPNLKGSEWEEYWKDLSLTKRGNMQPMELPTRITLDKEPYTGETTLYLLLEKTYGDDQTTCDEPKRPNPHPPAKESKGNKTIIKYYRTINDTTKEVSTDGVTDIDEVSKNITIEEELLAGKGYKVVQWGTSNVKKYDIDIVNWKVPGTVTQQGTTLDPATGKKQVVLNGSSEDVLYVLLEKHITEPPITSTADFIISQSTITRSIKLSSPDKAGMDLLKNATIRWKRGAHQYSCSHSHNYTDDCGNVKEYNSKGEITGSHCGGHTCTVHCNWGTSKTEPFTDNHVKLSIKNAKMAESPEILATKSDWHVTIYSTASPNYTKRYKEYSSGHVRTPDSWSSNDWDYACVILRGADKLTVAQWKNTTALGAGSANDDLKDASYKSDGTKVGFNVDDKGINGKNTVNARKKTTYTQSFTYKAADASDDLNTVYRTTEGVTCSHGNSYNCGENTRTFYLSDGFTVTPTVEVQTYSGSATGGVNDTTCSGGSVSKAFTDIPLLSGLTNVRGVEVPSGSTLSFIPYIQMNYDTVNSTAVAHGSYSPTRNKAYVLGDIKRSMTPNDYAEVSWKPRAWDKPNLSLESLQWSTHASVTDFLQSKIGLSGADLGKWTALPGGATLSLSIKKEDQQTVAVTTYQCIVEGTGKTQIDNAGGSYTGLTEADAKTAHTNYVNTVVNALDKTNVEQWVTWIIKDGTGAATPRVKASDLGKESGNVWSLSESSPVHEGWNLEAATHNGQAASSESKYYLANDTSANAASEGDLDVNQKSTITKKYTFYTNTFGDIYMMSGSSDNLNTETAGTKLTPGSLTGVAKEINDRTHVVDKLYKAVEKKKGNDQSGRAATTPDGSGKGTWYNEAFDGITVYIQSTELTVGYLNPVQRSVVLDPKLTQTQENQKDMFNKGKYNMSQYKTKKYSEAYPTEVDKLGEFKGKSVFTNDLQYLFYSKQFFIPNATVDDLH